MQLEQYAIETTSYNVYGLPNIPYYIHWNEIDTCDSTVNIISIKPELSEPKVFPNPFYDYLRIEGEFPMTIEMFNSIGTCVYHSLITNNIFPVSLKSLPEGLYVYRISNKNEIKKIGKLIKLE